MKDGATILIYVQHLLGVGHLRRAALLADGLAGAGHKVTLISGGVPTPALAPDTAGLLQLPPLLVHQGDFSILRTGDGQPASPALLDERRYRLLAELERQRPDAIILEMFPFGRRQMRFELIPFLDAAMAMTPKPVVLTSLRDILVAKKRPERLAEMVNLARRYCDAVLVHGDRDFVRLDDTFPPAAEIADRIIYTGFVVDPVTPPETPRGEVLVSAGGGAVGAVVLEAAMAAAPLSVLADRNWIFIAGPNLPPADRQRLAGRLPARSRLVNFLPDFPYRLAGCALSVSQAGYNTVAELLAVKCRAVLVPYERDGETEQRLRADQLAKRGLATVLPEAELSPLALARAMDRTVSRRGDAKSLDLRGIGGSVAAVEKMIEDRAPE